MPFIPFAATVGTALGTSAGVGGLVVAGTVAGIGSAVYSSLTQQAATKKLLGSQAAATKTPEQAQETALETAQKEMVKRRRSILSSGGQTDITEGKAILQSTTGNKLKSLLG